MNIHEAIRSSDRLFVQQQFRPLLNLYQISTVGSDGRSPQQLLCEVRQKRMKIREQIDFNGDEGRTPILRIKARSVFEVRGRYDILLPDGTIIGGLQKQFARSLLRSSWRILDHAGQEIATTQEQSMVLAVVRRLWGFVPVIGDYPLPVPFHFDIHMGGRRIGEYRRLVGLRDRYVLNLDGDPERRLDRLIAMALTIALDALQDR